MIKDTLVVAFLVTLGLGAVLAWIEPEPSTVTITTEQE
jgi:hypothetical protein